MRRCSQDLLSTNDQSLQNMNEPIARLFVQLQKLLPQYLLTSLARGLAGIRIPVIKNFFIRQFVRAYDVDIDDVRLQVPGDFASFNEFFIRELMPDARQVAAAGNVIAAPVDGTVSAAGKIEHNALLQAKGRNYTLQALLATDSAEAEKYVDGAYATIYLAPYNYHRVHAPVDAMLHSMRYVPGDLFSVNDATVRHLPDLFVRNERLVCHFSTDNGPLLLVFVGAMNVGTINTIWTGDIRPRKNGVVEAINFRDSGMSPEVQKGDLLGWFNFGSTVIVVFPADTTDNFSLVGPGATVLMGQAIGTTGNR